MASETKTEGRVLTRQEEELKEPDEYRVILLNDDFTTMEFVVGVLMAVFHKALSDAYKIMLDVHKKGRGVVGTYTYDIATTKISQVHELAKQNGFPLKCTMEKA
jgi:ATP-dependent Clp protease adaptor protein ClpS